MPAAEQAAVAFAASLVGSMVAALVREGCVEVLNRRVWGSRAGPFKRAAELRGSDSSSGVSGTEAVCADGSRGPTNCRRGRCPAVGGGAACRSSSRLARRGAIHRHACRRQPPPRGSSGRVVFPGSHATPPSADRRSRRHATSSSINKSGRCRRLHSGRPRTWPGMSSFFGATPQPAGDGTPSSPGRRPRTGTTTRCYVDGVTSYAIPNVVPAPTFKSVVGPSALSGSGSGVQYRSPEITRPARPGGVACE
jgi:hypothetical protein